MHLAQTPLYEYMSVCVQMESLQNYKKQYEITCTFIQYVTTSTFKYINITIQLYKNIIKI